MFRTAFRDAVKGGGARLVSTATLTAPWGTMRLSNQPFSPEEHGNYVHRIVGLTEVGPTVTPRAHSLGALEAGIVVSDPDRSLEKLIDQNEARLLDSPVVLQTAVKGLRSDDWYTYFTGALDAWPKIPSGYKLTFRTRDRPLRSDFPRRQISLGDRPNAPAASIGLYYQVVYGVHDSSAAENRGLIKAIEVDKTSTSNDWHCSLGRITIPQVFVDDALQAVSAYTVMYPLTNGFRETVLRFNPSVTGKKVWFDAQGLTDRAAGGGRVYTRPVETLHHAMANWVFGDWISETVRYDGWLDLATAPVEGGPGWMTDQYLGLEGHKSTLVLGGKSETADFLGTIEAYCRTFHIHPFWNEGDRIVFFPIYPHFDRFYREYPWVAGKAHELNGSFVMGQNTRQILSRATARWFPSNAESKFFQTVEVEDLAVKDDSKLALDMTNGAAEV